MAKTKKSPKATPKVQDKEVEVVDLTTGAPVEAEVVKDEILPSEDLRLAKIELQNVNDLYVGLATLPFTFNGKLYNPSEYVYIVNGEGKGFVIPKAFFNIIAKILG